MKIKSVTINKYKSITKPVTINFDENLIVFIGKNGSGKSNILEALNCIFSQNVSAQGSVLNRAELDAEISLVLSEEEVNSLKKFSDFDGNDMEITVGIKEGHAKTSYTIRNSQYVSILRKQYDAIVKLGNKIIPALQEYKDKLHSVLNDGVDVAVRELTNICDIYENCDRARRKIENVLSFIHNLLPIDSDGNVLTEEEISEKMERFEGISGGRGLEDYDFSFQQKVVLQSKRKKSKYITVDTNGLQKEIDQLNSKLDSLDQTTLNAQCKKLSELIVKYNNTSNMAQQVADNDRERGYGFWERIKEVILNKSYWIPSGEMIFYGNARDEDSLEGYVDYQYVRLFVETFIRRKYSEKNARKLIAQYKEHGKLDVDSKEFCDKLAKYISEDIPRFDNKMFKRVIVEGRPSHIKLSVEENNGEIVPFNATSLGRRWFFTYYFLKNRLGKNDILILDEPASALHPTAQMEILKDIEEVAKTHTVIMCTHSPYMISDEISSVNLVELVGKSTAVKSLKLGELPDYIQQAGMLASKDALFNLEKTHVLCEGPGDVACFKAFMKLLGVDTSRYQPFTMGGNTKLPYYLEYYANNGLPHPIIIMDADTKGNKIFDKQIAIHGTNKKQSIDSLISSGKIKVVFAGENTSMNCLEGMFSADDFVKFTEKKSANGRKQHKVCEDIAELLNKHGCSKETKQNFRNLFVKAGMLATK